MLSTLRVEWKPFWFWFVEVQLADVHIVGSVPKHSIWAVCEPGKERLTATEVTYSYWDRSNGRGMMQVMVLGKQWTGQNGQNRLCRRIAANEPLPSTITIDDLACSRPSRRLQWIKQPWPARLLN